jgi:hypothetical protein
MGINSTLVPAGSNLSLPVAGPLITINKKPNTHQPWSCLFDGSLDRWRLLPIFICTHWWHQVPPYWCCPFLLCRSSRLRDEKRKSAQWSMHETHATRFWLPNTNQICTALAHSHLNKNKCTRTSTWTCWYACPYAFWIRQYSPTLRYALDYVSKQQARTRLVDPFRFHLGPFYYVTYKVLYTA